MGITRLAKVLKKLQRAQSHMAWKARRTSHFMGTVRMGSNPGTSVVKRWHQAHDVHNLFIVDGCSFVTSGAVGPTPTIGVLALLCADGIWKRRRDWTRSAPRVTR